MFRKSILQVLVPFGCLALGAVLGRTAFDPGAKARGTMSNPESISAAAESGIAEDPDAVAEAQPDEECEETRTAGVCCSHGPLGCAEVYEDYCPEGAVIVKCPCSPYLTGQAFCEATPIEAEPAPGKAGT